MGAVGKERGRKMANSRKKSKEKSTKMRKRRDEKNGDSRAGGKKLQRKTISC